MKTNTKLLIIYKNNIKLYKTNKNSVLKKYFKFKIKLEFI